MSACRAAIFAAGAPDAPFDVSRPHASAAEKITLVLEGIGDDKICVNSSSLDHPLVFLPDQGIEIGGIEKKVTVGRIVRSAYWLNHDPRGRGGVRAGGEVTALHA